jgi:hypothetical protein
MLVVTSFVGNPSVISFHILSLIPEIGYNTSNLLRHA